MTINIDGTDVRDYTIDGTFPTEVTIDGSAVFSHTPGYDSFEAATDGDTPMGWYEQGGTIDNTYASVGDVSCQVTSATTNSEDSWFIRSRDLKGATPPTVTFAYRETSNNGGVAYKLFNTSGNLILAVGTSNPNPEATGTTTLTSTVDPDYGAWRKFTIDLDFGANTYDVEWHDVGGSSSGVIAQGLSFENNSSGIGEVRVGGYSWSSGGAGSPSANQAWVDEVWGGPEYRALVDSFEDQSLSEYTDLEDSGGASSFTFADPSIGAMDNNRDGRYCVRLSGDSTFPKAVSTSGLDNYPAEGDSFEWYTFHSTNSSTANYGVYFGVSDLSNLYFTRINASSPDTALEEKSGGTNSVIVSNTTDTPATGWVEWSIDWGASQSFTVTAIDSAGTKLLDGATGSASNHQVTSGGFGIWGAVADYENLFWDGVYIK